MPAPRQPSSAALAQTLVDELARQGVTDAVLSPGSRSAPLAVAFARHPGITTHVRIDERSGSFLALGITKVTGRPAAFLCTSGTATANAHPAVLEAHHAHLPLVVVTADRPPELRGIGANQTTDQVRLYGQAVRLFAELDSAGAEPDTHWRTVCGRAIAASEDGPVHLNVVMREPLGHAESALEPSRRTNRIGRQVAVAGTVPGHPHGVVVVGDNADPAAALRFAEAAGWPVLAEPQSGARRGPNAITHYADLLRVKAFRDAAAPDVVVSVGRPALSRAVQAYLASAPEHVVVDPHGQWADPTSTATSVIQALGVPTSENHDTTWLDWWHRCDARVHAAYEAELDSPDLSEIAVAAHLLAAAPPGALVFAGASMPIRYLDRVLTPRSDLRVLANRGLSGIDGTVSSAIGAALAHQRAGGGRAFALLGDLTLLHDQNGLLAGAGEQLPDVVIVVIDNDGGGIFATLGHTADPELVALFGTPHGITMTGVAAAAGWAHEEVRDADELRKAVAEPGPRIVVVRSRRDTNAAHLAELDRALASVVDEAVATDPLSPDRPGGPP
ncbi:2-succinyl-5-enolpyruvyl-6-hydroxy-3-cyclohexene-1-carboxylic-acid synthase [Lentzea sp. NPDC058436]|uniref:2-succinyl-5-enolpyruvyl-6-hydroxy-3- cyclohexene-1-carboxylic-acid synthase n=1 Tax=Lentzea sp. NPDC058436 TaxID=3346499 RepID=UPI003650900E